MPNTSGIEVTSTATASNSNTLARVRIPVAGMTCAACQSFVQRTLAGEEGVKDATVDLMLHNATVIYDPSVVSPSEMV